MRWSRGSIRQLWLRLIWCVSFLFVSFVFVFCFLSFFFSVVIVMPIMTVMRVSCFLARVMYVEGCKETWAGAGGRLQNFRPTFLLTTPPHPSLSLSLSYLLVYLLVYLLIYLFGCLVIWFVLLIFLLTYLCCTFLLIFLFIYISIYLLGFLRLPRPLRFGISFMLWSVRFLGTVYGVYGHGHGRHARTCTHKYILLYGLRDDGTNRFVLENGYG